MERTEIIVDTCFLQKISSEGKRAENIRTIMNELNYSPVIHPYMAEHELALHSYLDSLVKSGYIRKIEYNEFLHDKSDYLLYEMYYKQLYDDLRQYLASENGIKQMGRLDIRPGMTIYNTHKQGSNMGDIHMILMASFLKLPIILTEDSDIALLRTIAKKRMKLGNYRLDIYDGWDVVKKIAENPNSQITKKDLERLLLDMNRKENKQEMKVIWDENHLKNEGN